MGRFDGLEGDGQIDALFEFLWKKNKTLQTCPDVCIPDTIVYKYRQPAYWYFTSQVDGQIKKKNRNNLVNQKIEEHFMKRKNPSSEITAYYISTGEAPNGETQTSIEYLDEKSLHDFLFSREKFNNGFLQKFVEPKGQKNFLIRATWSPQVCLLERRVNHRRLNERKFDMYERAVSYEGAEHFSSPSPVTGVTLAAQIQKICTNIVEHVFMTSAQHHKISRMILNFKIDPKGKIWLLWCSSLRLEEELVIVKKSKLPATLSPTLVPANTRENQMALATGKHGSGAPSGKLLSLSNNRYFVCPKCGETHESKYKYEVTYKMVIVEHQKNRGSSLSKSKGELSSDDESGSDEGEEEDDGIPPLFKQMFPKISVSKFERAQRDPSFLYNVIYVCEECCLDFNQAALSALREADTQRRATSVAKIHSASESHVKRIRSTKPRPPGTLDDTVSQSKLGSNRAHTSMGIRPSSRTSIVLRTGKPRPHSSASFHRPKTSSRNVSRTSLSRGASPTQDPTANWASTPFTVSGRASPAVVAGFNNARFMTDTDFKQMPGSSPPPAMSYFDQLSTPPVNASRPLSSLSKTSKSSKSQKSRDSSSPYHRPASSLSGRSIDRPQSRSSGEEHLEPISSDKHVDFLLSTIRGIRQDLAASGGGVESANPSPSVEVANEPKKAFGGAEEDMESSLSVSPIKPEEEAQGPQPMVSEHAPPEQQAVAPEPSPAAGRSEVLNELTDEERAVLLAALTPREETGQAQTVQQ